MPRNCCAAMSERFMPLAKFLRPKTPEIPPAPLVAPAESVQTDVAETLAAARRFRAGLADALDVALEQLLTEIAEGVLARELRIAGPDIAAIVAEALARHDDRKVLSIRAHPKDLESLAQFGGERIGDLAQRPGSVL